MSIAEAGQQTRGYYHNFPGPGRQSFPSRPTTCLHSAIPIGRWPSGALGFMYARNAREGKKAQS